MIRHVACVGAGYVGGPSCAVIASRCPDLTVTVCDMNSDLIDRWNRDDLPIHEPGLPEIVRACRDQGNLVFTCDLTAPLEAADVIFVCVDTPPKQFGSDQHFAADTCNLERAFRNIAKVLARARAGAKNCVVVIKSTVPVGTGDRMEALLRASLAKDISHSVSVDIVSNPEFLAEGTAVRDMQNPSRVVVGCNASSPAACAVMRNLYERWVPADRILVIDRRSSEMCKLVSNAMLAQRITSTNCTAALCEKVGADVGQVMQAVGADPRIGPFFLNASVGFGGSCFRKDVMSLAHINAQHHLKEISNYWMSIVHMNDAFKCAFVRGKIIPAMFGSVRAKKIAVWGLAFKKDTSDVRDTPAASVVSDLLRERAHVHVHDPQVTEEQFNRELTHQFGTSFEHEHKQLVYHADMYRCAAEAHALVIMTEWDAFKSEHGADFKKVYESMEKPAFVFDGRRITNVEHLRRLGFAAYQIGKHQ